MQNKNRHSIGKTRHWFCLSRRGPEGGERGWLELCTTTSEPSKSFYPHSSKVDVEWERPIEEEKEEDGYVEKKETTGKTTKYSREFSWKVEGDEANTSSLKLSRVLLIVR
ncbi:hypothetical protein KQX54_007460 [Cotesia glomerata]|uniref:Uncharacterized protein n=1 Tax=Cotesia glomerata TaxID=32391 RepID=A0AAV7I3D2_COTGL|nr:hypothetical protein KQX54_007460 [Cotesia glomerata]